MSLQYSKREVERKRNYRPVSLTLEVGKILESIIKDFIVEHLKSSGRI